MYPTQYIHPVSLGVDVSNAISCVYFSAALPELAGAAATRR